MNITIYTTALCPWCKQAKEYLDARGITYTEIDVGANAENRAILLNKTGQLGVPVLDIQGTIVIGFDKDEIYAALTRERGEKK